MILFKKSLLCKHSLPSGDPTGAPLQGPPLWRESDGHPWLRCPERGCGGGFGWAGLAGLAILSFL